MRKENSSMILQAPAKINLGLKICRKREDGYHDIITVMQQIAVKDYICFKPFTRSRLEVHTYGADIALEDNIAYKAARLLQEKKKCSAGAVINLYKNIPLAAGLAGGSSNAAAVLRGLNLMWSLDLPDGRLLEMAEELGADVPFCFSGGTALAEGKGEKLFFIDGMPFFAVVLARPPELEVSTREIYYNISLKEKHSEPEAGFNNLLESIKHGNREGIHSWMNQEGINDLERAATRIYPQIKELKERFRSLGMVPAMTGSGPAVFSLLDSWKEAGQAAECLRLQGYQAWATWTGE